MIYVHLFRHKNAAPTGLFVLFCFYSYQNAGPVGLIFLDINGRILPTMQKQVSCMQAEFFFCRHSHAPAGQYFGKKQIAENRQAL
jgi:hypothetical protein